MKKGVIFDMDGTLWDSAEQVALSWTEVLSQEEESVKRVITKEDMYRVMGKTMDIIAEILFPDVEAEKRSATLRDCCDYENEYLRTHGGQLYDGLEDMLKSLSKKYNLYIVSNCQKGYIEGFLEYYHFEKYFKDIECYGNTDLKKGDNIRLVVERNALDDAVYVGDIQGDYDASQIAGIKFVHAAYGFGTIDAKVPFIKKLSDLESVLEEVFS